MDEEDSAAVTSAELLAPVRKCVAGRVLERSRHRFLVGLVLRSLESRRDPREPVEEEILPPDPVILRDTPQTAS